MPKQTKIFFVEDAFSEEKTFFFKYKKDAQSEYNKRSHSHVSWGSIILGADESILAKTTYDSQD